VGDAGGGREAARGETRAASEEIHDPLLARVFDLALPHLQTWHNENHTLESYRFALRILETEPGDPEIALLSVLLHDIGWSRVPEDQQHLAYGPNVKDPNLTKVHEREGARRAEEILREVGYPEDKIAVISEIVAGHDTRLTALSSSDAVVKDADKLFRISRDGFPINCRRFGLDPAKHLVWLERQIDGWFFTVAGKRLARHEAAARWRELGSHESAQ